MKKVIVMLISTILTLGLFGCQTEPTDSNNQQKSKQDITIGTSVISKDVLEVAQKVFNEKNDSYNMKIQVFDDAITPNIAVDEGSIDANFYQYEDYLDNFNKDKGTKLKTYGKEIFAFQIGLYSEKIKNISEIKNGMTVAIANDVSNRALALNLLSKEGIIKIKDGVEVPNVLDIEENKHKLKFIEVERLTLASAVSDTDMVIAMADVIREAGKDSEKALAFDQEEGIVMVLKEEKEWAKEVEEALTSDEVKKFILEETKGTKTPLF